MKGLAALLLLLAGPLLAQEQDWSEAGQWACIEQGGLYETVVDGGQFYCFRPTTDAGATCENSADCSGECLAESQSCTALSPIKGCASVINEAGQIAEHCGKTE